MKDDSIDTIGCDLGDKKTEICVLRGTDGQKQRFVISTTRKAFTAFLERHPAHVVIEVGAHSRWVSELAVSLGHEVTVANPRSLHSITRSHKKRDERDAEMLARLARADLDLLAPITHRGAQAQADLAVAKSRDLLVRTRTKLINHVRGLVKAVGERLPACSPESFVRKTKELVPAGLRMAVDPVYDVLNTLEQQIKTHDRAIERVATERYPDVAVLAQPSGVGTLTALVFLLTIDDKDRFTKSRTVGAFLGLCPKRSQSGDDDPQLGISKCGDRFLRRLLVNAANYIIGPHGPDTDLRRWGLELAKRGGKNAKKRAAVGVARKVAVLLHRLWTTGEVYQPLGYKEQQMKQAA